MSKASKPSCGATPKEAKGQRPRAVHTKAPGLMAAGESRKTQTDGGLQGSGLALINEYASL